MSKQLAGIWAGREQQTVGITDRDRQTDRQTEQERQRANNQCDLSLINAIRLQLHAAAVLIA